VAVRRLLLSVALVAATAAVIGVVVYGRMHASLLEVHSARPIPAGARVPAPPFAGATLTGADVSLHSFAGRPVVINFFASWCVPCRQEAPGLAQLARKFGARVQVLGISIDDKRPGAMAFVSHFHWTWPIVFDPSDNLAYQYGLVGKPTTVVVDQQGRIAWQHAGKIGAHPVEQVLQSLLRT
jgi:cytochrome c biogenesis protein CcmG/thiol:disulfide interchange protein DsbE